MSTKDIQLYISHLTPKLLGHGSAEVHTLEPLVSFCTGKEDTHGDEDDSPLPVDGAVHKDGAVDDGDVKSRRQEDGADGNRPEEEGVLPQAHGPSLETTTLLKDFGKE